MAAFPTLLQLYPSFSNLPSVGTFNNVSLEALLKLNPDLVINSMTSTTANQAIKRHRTVVGISTGNANTASELTEFLMTGNVLHNSYQAEQLVTFWNNQLQVITSRVQNISNKRSVFYALGSLTNTNGSALWGNALITSAGGINVAQSLGNVETCNTEQLLEWNPDVMILSSNEGSFMSISSIMNNTVLQQVDAVIQKQVYECPKGTFWWDRPAPEGILGITWLAQTLYPNLFTDVNLLSLSQSFYQQFYNYSLSSTQLQAFLNPTS